MNLIIITIPFRAQRLKFKCINLFCTGDWGILTLEFMSSQLLISLSHWDADWHRKLVRSCVSALCVLAAWWYVDEQSVFQASAVLWIDRDTASEWLWLTLLYSLTPLTRGWGERVQRGRGGRLRRARNLFNVSRGAGWQSRVQHGRRKWRDNGGRKGKQTWRRGENRQWDRQTDGLIAV